MFIYRVLPLLLVAMVLWPVIAQEDNPCFEVSGLFNEETGDCEQIGSVEISIRSPAWLADYPTAQAAVSAFINTKRGAFFSEAAANPFFHDRPLFFEVYYSEHVYTDEVVTLLFTVIEDLGGAYPTGRIHTITMHRADDAVLTITDVFAEDVDLQATLYPHIVDQIGQDSAEMLFYDTTIWETAEAYDTFTISEDALTLLYPFERQGAINAGLLPVEIPLDDLADVLAPSFRSITTEPD